MKIAAKSRLAVAAMLDLAQRCDHGPITLAAIGARQQVSLSYLELLFARLRRQGLVRSTRGPGGGYGLARRAADISVADIVLAVEEPGPPGTRAAEAPAGDGGAPDQRISSDWCADLERVMTRFMASVSLQDLAAAKDREAANVDTLADAWPGITGGARCSSASRGSCEVSLERS